MDIKPSKDRIIFKLHNPCGLFNQVSCIENAVALSHFLKKDLVIHHILNGSEVEFGNLKLEKPIGVYSANRWFNFRSMVDNAIAPKITDLMDICPYGEVEFVDHNLNIPAQIFTQHFYNFSDDKTNEDFFAVHKRPFDLDSSDHLSFTWTLGWYSTFFMNRSPEVNKALSLTRFKPEYYELAERVASSIGPFVGAHIRLTDHRFDYPTKEQIEEGIASLKPNYPVVIISDNHNHDLAKVSGSIPLEVYIEENFASDFRQLKFVDEVSLGLLSNLVMCLAEDFIGTQGSTFTGYIQRHVGGNMRLFGESPYKQTGPYTWNGYKYPVLRSAEENKKINYKHKLEVWDNSWWREWPESKLFPELV